MIKIFNLKFVVFLAVCLYSTVLTAQINSSTAVVPFGANPSYGNGIMPTNLPTGGTYGKSQDAADAYVEWKNNYTESCGAGKYRVKFDEPNRTVSEGIGYGMQLAAYAADKTLFDGLYAYWKSFQSPASSGKPGKLMNWRIEGCGPTVSGTGSAADADADAAWALLIAENQWPTATAPYDYASEATNILYSIRELEINNAGQLINGDGWGFGDNCRNPGYQSPAYYRFFATTYTAHTSVWNNAVNGAYTMINANAHPTTGLISDWSNPQGVKNTCNPGGLGYAATDGYGYDACRNPWRMAQDVIWNNDAQAKEICTRLANYISGRGVGNIGGPLYQTGANYSGYSHNATFVSTFAMAVMGTTTANQALMNSLYTETKNTKDVIKNSTLSGYFGNTLRCVALFMMSGNYWKPGTSSAQEINVRNTTFNIPSGETYDFLNQQITPPATTGKTVTLTIENLGFANLNLTGTPIVVLSGANADQYSITQPAAATLGLATTTTFVVTFRPTTVGTKIAKLTIASNDADEGSYVINLTGVGTPNATAAKMTVYDTLNILTSGSVFPMGAFTTGSTGSKVLKITNTGDASLVISSITSSSTAFSVLTPTLPLTIPIGGTKYVTIGYSAPATVTSSTSTLTFTTTDPNATSFILNATANAAPCSANPTNKIMLDYDGNVNLKLAFTPTGAFSPIALNPAQSGLNLSPTVASFIRETTGEYDIIRYYNCGTIDGTTHGTSTYIPFNISAANPAVQMLVYSPAVGITITVAPQKPTGSLKAWDRLISDYSSNISVTTTKANQWELLTFDMSKIIAAGVTGDFKSLDIQIDPLGTYAFKAANAAEAKRTFYIDQIKYGVNPCISDLSGILQDYDAHNNMSLDYAVGALSAPVANPAPGTLNTSANVGQFTKTVNAATFDDGFRYNGCSNKIDLSTKKYISMLVYAPKAGVSIQMSAKVPDTAADTDTYPDDAASSTQLTVFANTWHRIYFDLSTIATSDLTKVFGIDIFIDPTDLSAVTSPNNKFYFDDIRLETSLPCVTSIPATDILNDFENNRNLGVVFPGAASFNTIKANPTPGGINTSTVIGEFTRGVNAAGTSVRFSACQGKLDLAAGHNIIDLKVYSPNAKVAVIMSLKNAAGVSLSDVTDTIKLANTWTNLRFDHSNILNSTAVAFIDIIVDPGAVYSATGSTVASRTYGFDDLRYSLPAPEINVKALTSPATDIPTTGSFTMGTAAIGDSTTALDFSIQNNGLQTLLLSGTPTLKLAGANPEDFVITTTQTFTTSIGALGATGFTVTFKPKGTVAGARSASLTILNNDSNEGTYVIYLNGTATKATLAVLDGGVTTSPVIANNNPVKINIGSAEVGVAATPIYTMSIKNTGVAPLKITSIVVSNPTVFTLTPLTPTGDILAGAIATFKITGKPAVVGANDGIITVVSNDPAAPSYKVNITVTGAPALAPVISVFDGLTPVPNNNPTVVAIGSAVKGSPAAAYTLKITNTGTAPLTVTSITGMAGFVPSTGITPTGPIAVGASATFTVVGTPALVGPNLGSVTIVTNDLVTPSYKVNLSVIGLTGVIVVKDKALATVANNNPTAISMGSALVGSAASPTYTFTISNTGTGALTVASITSSSTVFAASAIAPAGPIAPNGTATFTVTATPSLTGSNTGVLTITTNDAVTPTFKVNVSVTGTAPILKVLDGTLTVLNNNIPSINVGTSTVGVAATPYTTFSISNTGTGPLTLTSITGSANFPVSLITPAAPTTIAVGASATFTVIAKPTLVGANDGTITIVTNDPTTPSFVIKVTATGTATTPKLTVKDGTTVLTTGATPPINVGTASTGSAAPAYTTFSITNTGTAALSLTSITASPSANFSVTGATPGPIAPNGTVTFTVTGTPTVDGANPGTITIATNDPTTGSFVINVVVTGTNVPTPVIKVQDGTTPLVSAVTVVNVGTAFVNSPAAAYTTISIKNSGTGPLTLTSILGSAGFNVSAISSVLPTTIPVNGTATFTVTGTPALVGPNSGTIKIATNDAATPIFTVNVTVTGKPLVPELNVLNGSTALTSDGTAINVGTAPLGMPAAPFTSFSISNTGNGPLTVTSITGTPGFNVTNIPTTIAANATATFTVTATPASIGANPGKITIATNDPTTGSFVINVVSTGVSASPVLEVYSSANVLVQSNNTPAVSIGSAVIGSPAPVYTFTVKNTGNVALTGLNVLTASTGFTVGAPSATTIAIGGSVTFTVTGTPSSALTSGLITISSANAPSYVVNVSVTGTAAATSKVKVLDGATEVGNNNTPALVLPSATINTPGAAKTLTITNTGTATLTITDITASTGFTVVASPSITIAVGASATFTVSGTPNSTTVARTGTVTIASNDPASPYTVNVSVSGTTSPTATVTIPGVTNGGAPISIGNAIVGNPTPPHTFTVTNTGSVPLDVTSITSSNPDFVVSNISPNPIPAGGTGTFTVVATPSTVGTSNSAITINSNDPNSPFVINVAATGTGVPSGAVLQVLGKSLQVVADNGSFIIGANALNMPTTPYTFTLKNIGSTDLVIDKITTGSGFVSSQPYPSKTITPGATATISVYGTPNNASATRWGAITIFSNDVNSPFTIQAGVNVGVATGVAKALASNAIDLYPNPSTGNTNLEFNGAFDQVSVTVYTADGSKVYTTGLASISESSAMLPLEDLPSGVYVIEVNTAQGKLIKRFIKQ